MGTFAYLTIHYYWYVLAFAVGLLALCVFIRVKLAKVKKDKVWYTIYIVAMTLVVLWLIIKKVGLF